MKIKREKRPIEIEKKILSNLISRKFRVNQNGRIFN